MGSYQYRLDGWDVLLFAVGLVATVVVGGALGFKTGAVVPAGFAVGVGAVRARRHLNPDDKNLVFEGQHAPITSRLLPMILVGIGCFVSVCGAIGILIVLAMISDGYGGTTTLVVPLLVAVGGAIVIAVGVKRLRHEE